MLNPQLQKILDAEAKRQNETLGLIPSENYSSKAVREAVGSVFMHKYSEGYPGARYYEGNENIDKLENLAITMVKKVFRLPSDWGANVQPLAGSNANLGIYNALLEPGDKILSMYLPDGGHLSHGWSYTPKAEVVEGNEDGMVYRGGSRKVNIVSKIYNVVQYKTDPKTFLLDYDFLENLALEEKPKMIVTGGTAYPRNIDYKRMKAIAEKVGAYYLADVAHEAGLIAADVLESPIGIADVVMFTTHKTLRGPKGAVIVARNDLIETINKAIMPGMQGGAHNGTIAGIAQALFEADTPEFKEYSAQILKNARTLASELMNYGFKLISGGTDKHLILIDVTSKGTTGKYLARALSYAGIVVNMNTIPYEKGSPLNPSGLRIGTPIVTTRGMKEQEMKLIAKWINEVANEFANIKFEKFTEFDEKAKRNELICRIRNEVLELCKQFPLNL